MGAFANSWWVLSLAIIAAVIITGLNAKLAFDAISGWVVSSHGAWWAWCLVVPFASGLMLLLLYLVFAPLIDRGWPRLAPPAPEPGLAPAGSRGSRGALPMVSEPQRWYSGSYRHIAIAVELADADDNVLHFLRRAQFAPEAELVFVHVAESAASRWLGEQSHDSESREDLEALEALAREFVERGIRSTVRLGHGEPAPEIGRIAREERADLLITGSHGHTGLSDAVFGATVSRVRHLVACPILTVPPRGRG